MKDKTFENIGVMAVIVGIIGTLVLSPVITFGFAYLGGLILKLFVGQHVVDGLNLIFNTTRFTPNLIPLTCAIFATIGKYFKSTQSNKENKK